MFFFFPKWYYLAARVSAVFIFFPYKHKCSQKNKRTCKNKDTNISVKKKNKKEMYIVNIVY